MERKLVKQGKNALTITLPSKWIQKFNLSQNDSIQINEEKENLIISTHSGKKEKNCEIDIKNLSRGLAFHIITGKYIQGYDKIIIKHNNFKLSQEIGNGFFGFMVEKHDETELIMKDMIKIPQDNFIEIFKRSCQLLIQQARTLKKLENNKINFGDVKDEERLLDSNIFYCLRYINKYEKLENSYKYFLLTTTLETVGDSISEIAKYLDKKETITKEETKLIENIIMGIEEYVTYLFQNNIEKMYNSLNKFKQNIEHKTFIDGIAFSIRENLYNYIGFLIENKNKK